MKFTRTVFQIAGIYGLIVLVPQFFLERQTGEMNPPAITHPEFFYGFLGVAVAWQVGFLIIARDPLRYRPLFVAAMIEKFSFAIATAVLFFQQRLAASMFVAGMIDLILGILFVVAWRATAGFPQAKNSETPGERDASASRSER